MNNIDLNNILPQDIYKYVEKGFKSGIFTIQDADASHGCQGIICRFHNIFTTQSFDQDSEFYFSNNTDRFETAAEYLQQTTASSIIQEITDTICDMIVNEVFYNEAMMYITQIQERMSKND